jgi:4-aminobutyrate aminotransferase-like enzyme
MLLDKIETEAMKGDLQVGGKTYGLILDVGGYHKNVITFAPSLHISYEEIDLALTLLEVLMRRCI